ncbi:dehydrogenase/reductase SDR family member 7 isoform X2 [Cucurbita pepo subsp. pepo]|uniref:dehydrogenase/reductase SDR family member 7 isoform X2 n=1 Tax=Cucurbita pepo subsp. pepo TaxID=3664 RepID=UPI000C9D5244|nr:dehydrogenase/reductase SDR family member 7 isoform X2 [Cucurbita pepo subsp. pepo]
MLAVVFFWVSFFLLLLLLLFKFATAHGDFTLMSKKHVKREEIEDKVVWITGASRGIGEVLAKQLAGLGAKLIISARDEAGLERVKNELSGKFAPNEVKVLPLDLSSGENKLKEAVEIAESLFPGSGVDYMIHNAAFERPKSTALDVSEESMKTTFDVNVLGTISLTRLLTPRMLQRGQGHFVVMSSAAGKTPAPGQAVYSASKHALNGYFHSLRSELYHKGIRVTVVCPGPIETSTGSGAEAIGKKGTSEKRLSSERCAQLTIIAASHNLKEVWISSQPVLAVMYLVQYMPTIGYWLMDKIGGNRVEAAARKGNTYSLSLLFGKNKSY